MPFTSSAARNTRHASHAVILPGERMVMRWPLIFSGMMKLYCVRLEMALTTSAISALENSKLNLPFLARAA